MRLITRSVAAVMAPLMIAGCEGLLGVAGGPDDDDGTATLGPNANETAGVAVIADVRAGDDVISYTVKNGSPDTVYLTEAYLERREGDGWQWVDAGVPRAAVLYTWPIPSAEDFSVERPIEDGQGSLLPGQYRFRLSLFEDRRMERLLPKRVRTSNTIRIE